MIAPLTVVVALTLRFGPLLQPAFSVSPFTLRTGADAVIAGFWKKNFCTARPLTLAALSALVAFGTVPRLDSWMFAPVSASDPTSEESTARWAIFDRVTLRLLSCSERTALLAMFLEVTALRAMSPFLTLLRPGSAVAVPASATLKAINATTIAGDGK
jgi:hypothetical protein